MSSIRLLVRPVSKWVVPRRSIHSTAVFRATAEQETEAAAQRKYYIKYMSVDLVIHTRSRLNFRC
jgi:hypothetical protein